MRKFEFIMLTVRFSVRYWASNLTVFIRHWLCIVLCEPKKCFAVTCRTMKHVYANANNNITYIKYKVDFMSCAGLPNLHHFTCLGWYKGIGEIVLICNLSLISNNLLLPIHKIFALQLKLDFKVGILKSLFLKLSYSQTMLSLLQLQS